MTALASQLSLSKRKLHLLELIIQESVKKGISAYCERKGLESDSNLASAIAWGVSRSVTPHRIRSSIVTLLLATSRRFRSHLSRHTRSSFQLDKGNWLEIAVQTINLQPESRVKFLPLALFRTVPKTGTATASFYNMASTLEHGLEIFDIYANHPDEPIYFAAFNGTYSMWDFFELRHAQQCTVLGLQYSFLFENNVLLLGPLEEPPPQPDLPTTPAYPLHITDLFIMSTLVWHHPQLAHRFKPDHSLQTEYFKDLMLRNAACSFTTQHVHDIIDYTYNYTTLNHDGSSSFLPLPSFDDFPADKYKPQKQEFDIPSKLTKDECLGIVLVVADNGERLGLARISTALHNLLLEWCYAHQCSLAIKELVESTRLAIPFIVFMIAHGFTNLGSIRWDRLWSKCQLLLKWEYSHVDFMLAVANIAIPFYGYHTWTFNATAQTVATSLANFGWFKTYWAMLNSSLIAQLVNLTTLASQVLTKATNGDVNYTLKPTLSLMVKSYNYIIANIEACFALPVLYEDDLTGDEQQDQILLSQKLTQHFTTHTKSLFLSLEDSIMINEYHLYKEIKTIPQQPPQAHFLSLLHAQFPPTTNASDRLFLRGFELTQVGTVYDTNTRANPYYQKYYMWVDSGCAKPWLTWCRDHQKALYTQVVRERENAQTLQQMRTICRKIGLKSLSAYLKDHQSINFDALAPLQQTTMNTRLQFLRYDLIHYIIRSIHPACSLPESVEYLLSTSHGWAMLQNGVQFLGVDCPAGFVRLCHISKCLVGSLYLWRSLIGRRGLLCGFELRDAVIAYSSSGDGLSQRDFCNLWWSTAAAQLADEDQELSPIPVDPVFAGDLRELEEKYWVALPVLGIFADTVLVAATSASTERWLSIGTTRSEQGQALLRRLYLVLTGQEWEGDAPINNSSFSLQVSLALSSNGAKTVLKVMEYYKKYMKPYNAL